MSELPPGWADATLAQVARWGSGGTPSRSRKDYFAGKIPWVKTGELGPQVIFGSEERITHEALENSSAKIFPKGAVALAMYGATIGKASILGVDAATNQACAVGVPDDRLISSEYLYFYLVSQQKKFVEQGKGGAQPNISQGIVKEWPIPLAPRAEQDRITAKVSRLIQAVAQCRSRLKRVSHLLRRFRQAVLEAAVSGRLTEEWRQARHVSNSWECVRLQEIATAKLGKMLDVTKNRGEPMQYLRNLNVRWFDFDLSDLQEIRVTPIEAQELAIRVGDLLVCEGGEPGRCAVWRGSDDQYVYQKALHRVRVGSRAEPEWLCYALKNAADSGALSDLFTGTTIKHLTGIALSKFELPLPCLEEQKMVIKTVKQLLAAASSIDNRVACELARCNAMAGALLEKAFRGELVPQYPGDEPASVTLERITAGQEAVEPSESRRQLGKARGRVRGKKAVVAEREVRGRRRA